jgi:hypothetical protein
MIVHKKFRKLRPVLRFWGPVFLFLALLGGAPAEARELTVDDSYTIDIPADWEATSLEPGYMMFTSPDKKAVFLVTIGQSMPKHREKVTAMVKRFDNLRIGSPARFVTLMRIQRKRVAVTVLGDHPDRVKVYWSIKEAGGDAMKAWKAN